MNTVQTPSLFSRIVSERATISVDFLVVCLWSIVGLLLTDLVFALGFEGEMGQALALAG